MNNHEVTGFNATEAQRRIANSVRIGVIEDARYDMNHFGAPPEDPEVPWFHNKDIHHQYRGPLYRVRLGDHLTYWLPQLFMRAGGDLDFWAYEVGEQVMVLSPSGDPMQGILLGSLSWDATRPPVGADDQTEDGRPWRETVRRTRYKDGMLWEYDRYLHREQRLYPDGTREQLWCLDDREDRSPRRKETNSDKSNVPPRHLHQMDYQGGTQYQFIHDEDTKIHHRHWMFPDGAVLDIYTYDYENLTHTHSHLHADQTCYYYVWDEKNKTHTQVWTWPDGRVWSYTWDEEHQTHSENHTHADGVTYQFQWDEKAQTHQRSWVWPDGRQWSYVWDEKVQIHTETLTQNDGLVYLWQHDEQAKTHQRSWTWPDGRTGQYIWDETAQTHTDKRVQADGVTYLFVWNEQAKTHTRQWTWPDGRIETYLWDESGQLHHKTVTQADGTIFKYHYSEGGDSHLAEMAFSDGTIFRHHYNNPHQTEIIWPDGGTILYNVATGHLEAMVKGDLTAQIGQKLIATAGQEATVTAPTINLKGNVNISGHVTVGGTLGVSKEVSAQQFIDTQFPGSLGTI